MTEYRLERLTDENADRWEAFNASSPEGSLFHSLRWKRIVEKHSDNKSHYCILYKNDDVFGLFPFTEQSSRHWRGLIPLSYPARLPSILKDYSDPLAMQSAIDQIRRWKGDPGRFSHLLLTSLHKETLDAIPTYPALPYEVGGDMKVDLSATPPGQIWDALSRSHRNRIRRFDKDGFQTEEIQSEDDLRRFYHYYEKNIRYIEGDLRPFSYFIDLWNAMGADIRITLLAKGPVVAGSSVMLLDKVRGEATGAYMGLNRELSNTYTPSYYIYWEALTWAWENNYRRVNYGTQQQVDTNDPRYRVKASTGGQFEPKYTKVIPLTLKYTMGLKWAGLRSGPNNEVSSAGG